MFENDFAVGIDDESGVVEVVVGSGIFGADDEMFGVAFAPGANAAGDGAVKGVFAEDVDVGVGMFLFEEIEFGGDFEFDGKFELDAGEANGLGGGRGGRRFDLEERDEEKNGNGADQAWFGAEGRDCCKKKKLQRKDRRLSSVNWNGFA